MAKDLPIMCSSDKEDCASEATEERINVAIRMRPLSKNNAPDSNARVWRVSQKNNSVTETTAAGEPLPERVKGRNFFTFDKMFGEDSSTRQVYDSVAGGILSSVMNGLNGTIFAYGQTNSGKTYTMQGGGTIEEGGGNKGGIVHMAARDIFSHISKDPQRIFLIRVSFIEIYNEEVRDLLVTGNDGNVLAIREDPRRGVFVNATESFVTGYQSLLCTLFAGEKKRCFASTEMNARSSRSHTIFRINIESRKRPVTPISGVSANEEDDGAVKISTLNLVDLAGSESVKHTGATGERQKEGAKINQSLLTLSRVIAALGSSSTHINFRDSKLTRILQPALSGNARIAIICCATPSELYLNETRNSLQFATRAKLVKTRAKINEVLDDRSLIKKLQRELIFAKRASSESRTLSQFKALEIEAANANKKAEESEKNLQRLKLSILRGGLLHGFLLPQQGGQISAERHATTYSSANTYCNVTAASINSSNSLTPTVKMSKPRRMSDSFINRTNVLMDYTNLLETSSTSPKDNISKTKNLANTKAKCMNQREKMLDRSSELSLLKEAFGSKAAIARSLQDKIVVHENAMREHDDLLSHATKDIALLKRSNDGANSEVVELISKRETLEEEKLRMSETHATLLAERDAKNQDMIDTHTTLLAERDAKNQDTVKAMEIILSDRENADSMPVSLQSQQDNENKKLKKRIQELISDNNKILQQHRRLEQENISLLKKNRVLNSDLNKKEELIKMEEEIVEDRSELKQANVEKNDPLLSSTITQPSTNLKISDNVVDKLSLKSENVDKVSEAEDSTQYKMHELSSKLISLEEDSGEQQSQRALEKQVEEASTEVEDTSQSVLSMEANHEKEVHTFNVEIGSLLTEKDNLTTMLSKVQQEAENYQLEKNELVLELEFIQKASDDRAKYLTTDTDSRHNIAVQSLNADIKGLFNEKDKMSIILDQKQQELESYQAERKASVLKLEYSITEADTREKALILDIRSIKTSHEGQIQALNTKVSNFSNEKESLATMVKGLQEELGILRSEYNTVLKNMAEQEKASILYKSRIHSLSTEISWLSIEKESLSDKLVEIWETL